MGGRYSSTIAFFEVLASEDGGDAEDDAIRRSVDVVMVVGDVVSHNRETDEEEAEGKRKAEAGENAESWRSVE